MTISLDEFIKRKNLMYGDSVGKSAQITNILFPDGIFTELYHRIHFIIRIFDKLCRLSSRNLPIEASLDAWRDVAGYAILAYNQEVRANAGVVDGRSTKRSKGVPEEKPNGWKVYTNEGIQPERSEGEDSEG